MNAASTLAAISSEKLVMVVRAPTAAAARTGIAAAAAGGARIIEVTYTVPDAVAVIRGLAAEPELVVGVGTVRTVAQAEAAVSAGARFIVSPGLDERVVRYAIAHDILVLPGVFTPTEVLHALDLGVAAVKLFPADQVGPAHLRALRGPLPDLRVIPSGGVNGCNATDWLDAGAIAVGTSSLSPAVSHPDSDSITAETRRLLSVIRGVATPTPHEGDAP